MSESELRLLGTNPGHGVVRRRIRTVLWFVVWGLVGLAVAHGPLEYGLSVYSVLVAVVTGLIMATLVRRSMVSRRSRRKWRLRFVWPARFLLAYLVVIVLLQLYATGALPAVWRNYGYQFDRLADAITAHYPALHDLETDWSVLRATYRAQAEQATDDRAFLMTVADMLTHFEGSRVTFGEDNTGSDDTINGAVVAAEILPSGIGYIEVTSFDTGTDVVKQFDEALARLGEVPGLIIDLRRNSQGSAAFANQVAGRFLAEPFTYATISFRHRLPHLGWANELTYTVKPQADVYKGPVAVLTGAETMRAAEAFAFAMQESGRAVLIGEATAGAAGVPLGFNLPGGVAHFTVGRFQPTSGADVDGVGVQPDVPASADKEEIPGGEDVVLTAAIDYLIQRL